MPEGPCDNSWGVTTTVGRLSPEARRSPRNRYRQEKAQRGGATKVVDQRGDPITMGAHFARKGNQMAGYFIASYDVSNADTYAKYNPGSLDVIMGTVAKHGGKLLVATDQARGSPASGRWS